MTERTETVAPLLVAGALGELSAENLAVEIVDMPGPTPLRGDGTGRGRHWSVASTVRSSARSTTGSAPASCSAGRWRHPSDLDTPQAGLWLRRGLIDEDGWDDVEGQTVLVPGGLAAAAVQPIDTLLAQHSLGVTNVDIVPASSSQAVDTLHAAAVGGGQLAEPDAIEAATMRLMLATTTPGSESIDGTVFAPRLLGADRAVGLAYARALIRTINTHLPNGYEEDALTAVAEALTVDEDVVAEAGPLFDWEIRSGTTTRLQDALTALGGVGFERPIAEDGLVDRAIAAGVIAAATDPG